MRKWLLVFSIVGLLLVSSVCILFFEDNQMTITHISTKRALEIEEKLAAQAEKAAFSLMFAGEKLPYDAASETYFLPVTLEDDEWESGAFSLQDGGAVVFLEDFTKRSKREIIAANEAIPFFAITNSGYAKGYLKFSGLPILTFHGTEDLTQQGEPVFQMELYEPVKEKDWVTKVLTTSTLRGNTSLTYEKKSLRLKLKKQKEDGTYRKENKNLLEIRDDDDWILNSLYADNSRIRDKLAMELWQEVGAYQNPYQKNFGVTGEYVEVFINDGYAGLYLLTHPIDKKQLGMDSVSAQMSAGKTVIERIYKKKYSAAWSANDFVGELPDANQPDYRGGFYLKGDTILATQEEWEMPYKVATCMEADDTVFARDIGALVDVSNVVDNWLFFQAIAGFDNENKNVYFVTRQKENSAYGYFIPWDMNLSFGALYAENEFFSTESMKELNTLVAFEPGMRMIASDVGGAGKLAKIKWESWRKAAFATEKVCNRMDQLIEILTQSGAMQREMERWPNGNADPDITFMKKFTTERLDIIDEYSRQW